LRRAHAWLGLAACDRLSVDGFAPFENGLGSMLDSDVKPAPLSAVPVLSNCPQCDAGLTVLRIIPGRAGSEYWTMRCTKCGGIHLDIVKPRARVFQMDGSAIA
jgi:hypothetical protein